MCDLICDVITCCVRSCDTEEINTFYKIMLENHKKREYKNTRNFFLHISPS